LEKIFHLFCLLFILKMEKLSPHGVPKRISEITLAAYRCLARGWNVWQTVISFSEIA
jgi:hypothetical protein